MRGVLDANVLVRAMAGPSGPAAEVLREIVAPPHLFITSLPLLEELARVAAYERVKRMHQLDEASVEEYILELHADALIVPIQPEQSIVTRDPDDDLIIATAVAGQADVICTRDKHFRDPAVQSYCTARGIQIMTDVELLEVLRQAGSPPD